MDTFWYIDPDNGINNQVWDKRDDWKNTTLARFGEPASKYVAYVDSGPPEKRVIAQLNHQLDIIHDLLEKHLPYVLPIVFATTMANTNWSIGLEAFNIDK
jgi:hypothetical protein